MTLAADHHRHWLDLPVGTLADIVGDGAPLILAPHPDDESLGCGGLIAACVAAGRPPLVVVLTDGTGSHPHSRDYPPEKLRATREHEVIAALACLGLAADRLACLREPDTAAPHEGPAFDAAVARVGALARDCSVILVPWPHDPHCDHEAAARIAVATGHKTLFYPVWGWTLPDDAEVPVQPGRGWRLDITPHLAAKQRAIHAHRSQYGGLITDDPTGFQLPPGLLSVFQRPHETFLLP